MNKPKYPCYLKYDFKKAGGYYNGFLILYAVSDKWCIIIQDDEWEPGDPGVGDGDITIHYKIDWMEVVEDPEEIKQLERKRKILQLSR